MRILLSILATTTLVFVLLACQREERAGEREEERGEVVEVHVAPQATLCPGLAPQERLVVDGECFYGVIEGFDHEDGFEYVLRVRKTKIPDEEWATEGPNHYWELLEVKDKKRPGTEATAEPLPAATTAATPTEEPAPTAATQEPPEMARSSGILPLGPCHLGGLTDEEEEELREFKRWLDGDDRSASVPLHTAAGHYGRAVVLTVLNDGADANARDEDGRVPLHWAVYNNEHPELPEVIRALVECGGADPSPTGQILDVGWTPLHELEYGHSQDSAVAQALIDAGADPNAKTDDGYTPLHNFVQAAGVDVKDPAVAQVLLDAGADVNARTDKGETPLHLVRNLDVFKILLNAGAEVNVQDNNGNTPLHVAPGPIFQTMLLEAGADPNAKDNYGRTPLFGVWEEPAKVQALLDAGADIGVTDLKGQTPLFNLTHPENLEVFQALLAAGVDPNAQNSDGQTVLHIIQGSFTEEAIQWTETLARLLLDAGADPNIQDQYERTPLHYANAPGPAQMLLDAGADPTIRDHKDWTPLDKYLAGTETSRRRGNAKQIVWDTIEVLSPPQE